ncbi:MAG TPA: dihydrofolate reductase [Pyrinomonadaceae bacterium]|nr:dihydrofolate reductase [Pyrinomonadaceae bacterium]
MISGIVAVDKNGAIGKGGKLPWHYSADMKFFKETTTGNAVVMGRKTWLTLKKPLPNRVNIVLSRKAEIKAEDSVVVLREVDAVLALAKTLDCDLYVIGGEQVYGSFLPHIDRWIVTRVPLVVEAADAFVPQNYLDGFLEVGSKELEPNLVAHYYERRPND